MNQRRMINSGIWQDEEFANLSDSARLLFIGMFSIADDEGKLKANPLYLKASVFMYDQSKTESDVLELLNEISKQMKSVLIYQVDGKSYAKFLKWDQFQTIRADRKKPSQIPEPTNCQPIDNQVATNCQPIVSIKEGKGNEEKGSEKKRKEVKKKKHPTFDCFEKIQKATDTELNKITEDYHVPIAFVRSKIDDMSNWLGKNGHSGQYGKPYKDWMATLRNWVKDDSIKRKEEHGKRSSIVYAGEIA